MPGQQYVIAVTAEDAGKRMDVLVSDFLLHQHTGVSRTSLQKLIAQGGVRRAGESVSRGSHKVREGEEYTVFIEDVSPSELSAEDIPLSIVHEDEAIIVLNKQPGLVVHPAPGNTSHTLVNALLHHTRDLSSINPERPGIVHRLDKDTSGVMVVAKTNESHLFLAGQFAEHSIRKVYCALVQGVMEFDEGVIEVPIGRHPSRRKEMAAGIGQSSKEALTRYHTLARGEGVSLVELFPRTGRTHQLRVHLAFIGHPIMGDDTYGRGRCVFSRLALHARSIGFVHPLTRKDVEYSAPLPEVFDISQGFTPKKNR